MMQGREQSRPFVLRNGTNGWTPLPRSPPRPIVS